MTYFDYNQFIKDYIPYRLRTQLNLDWFNVLHSPTIDAYIDSVALRNTNIFDTKHTGQTLSLEHLLNTKINVLGKKIIIANTGVIPQWYIGEDDDVPFILVDFYTYQGNSIEYQPNLVYIGRDSESPTLDKTLWVGTDSTILEDRLDFVVYVDYLDYIDSEKLQLINFYIERYKLAGFSYEVIPY